MKVVFLGVGEACDERLPNTSIWIQTEAGHERKSILLDCGFTAPPLYWRQTSDPEDLDALWISHFHGDHFFGTPALLLRFWELKRKKPLLILGQAGIEDRIWGALDLAYPGFPQKLGYEVQFITAKAGKPEGAAGLTWLFAENGHPQPDLAVRIEDGRHRVFYSGDGAPTQQTLDLARGCDLIIHESFRLEDTTPGHGTIRRSVDFAREAGAPALALVHVQRDERRERYQEIVEFIKEIEGVNAIMPEPGDEISL